MNEVVSFIKKLKIPKDEKVIVACSGGPDSMFLLNLLYNMGLSCVVAHINHKVRQESDEEYSFLKDYCENKKIIFEGKNLDGYVGGNFENYARNFRYSFFKEIVKKYDAKYLFTAHHGDDLVETILMRLTRGSSLKGYAGFSSLSNRDGYTIVRPLIYLDKTTIENYNKDNDIPYRLDYTNDLDDYTRNRFRHNILPFLKDEDNLVHLRFLKFSQELKMNVDYIDTLVSKKIEEMYIDNILNLGAFLKEDEYIKRKIINKILEMLYPDNLYLVNSNHIDEILKIINSKQPNIAINLPNNMHVVKEYLKLYFDVEKVDVAPYKYELEDEVKVPNGIIKRVLNTEDKSNFTLRLNSKDIDLPIIVRNRRDGDKMQVKNMKGHKKVNDIFIDLKIEQRIRDEFPIVTDVNDKILWLPGLKKSNFDIPIDAEYDIILRYEKGEELNEQKN
ncbi:MAG: tRNA lysidine(34) synthetase TilS [Bacilli bacterium]|nr:tRNA lysidine(34) synthetase TilS [Bacilli bacterium]